MLKLLALSEANKLIALPPETVLQHLLTLRNQTVVVDVPGPSMFATATTRHIAPAFEVALIVVPLLAISFVLPSAFSSGDDNLDFSFHPTRADAGKDFHFQ